MDWNKHRWIILAIAALLLSGCFRYSFTGASIPPDVETIYIPFFQDQSSGGVGDLSNQLNQALIDRFVNQSRLNLANEAQSADAVLEGVIVRYNNEPFSVGANEQTQLNQVTIRVSASFQYTDDDSPLWDQQFTGQAEFDPNENPIEGEATAANEALEDIAQTMFTESVGKW